jgi:hypothetical protein
MSYCRTPGDLSTRAEGNYHRVLARLHVLLYEIRPDGIEPFDQSPSRIHNKRVGVKGIGARRSHHRHCRVNSGERPRR